MTKRGGDPRLVDDPQPRRREGKIETATVTGTMTDDDLSHPDERLVIATGTPSELPPRMPPELERTMKTWSREIEGTGMREKLDVLSFATCIIGVTAITFKLGVVRRQNTVRSTVTPILAPASSVLVPSLQSLESLSSDSPKACCSFGERAALACVCCNGTTFDPRAGSSPRGFTVRLRSQHGFAYMSFSH